MGTKKAEEVEILHLGDLKPDKKNARKHTPRNIGMVVRSLQEVGAARSGVIDEEGNILAGSGTWEALSEAGIERVKVIEADGNEWVVVKRKGLSPEQKVKLALYDNRTGELSYWDTGVLMDISKDLDLGTMFTDAELEGIVDKAYLPEFHPDIQTREYTEEDIAAMKEQLEKQFKARRLENVKCPACGEEFYLEF